MPEDPLHNYFTKKIYTSTMGADMQTIPARHGTATFVPAGSTIKIVNTSGTQIIDTWAFALPSPPKQKDADQAPNGKIEEEPASNEQETPKPAPTPKRKGKKGDNDLPSQEEAEAATAQGIQAAEDGTPAQKKGWSSYVPSLPSLPLRAAKSDSEKATVKQNSRTWGQYFSAGQGITNYIPNKNSFSSFAKTHARDPNKPYIQQLTDFSRTPVGAAGMSALSGQGYASSLYAGYSAWTGGQSDVPAGMEYLSMPHSRAATLHLVPKVGDVLVSNLREPMLTIVEDTSATHDTLIAACDPARYQQLGVDKWEEHGSCAENLVLALKELNERAGLKGPKGIGAEVTVNSVPAPLNLFMNIPWTNGGDVKFDGPKGKSGEYIRLKAERDLVVVMSSCPQDVVGINGGRIQDGEFVVEEELEEGEDIRQRLQSAETQKRPVPQKRVSGVKKVNGTTPAAPAANKTPAAASAAKPAAGKTPIGQTKKPRTPIGQKKAVPSAAKATPAASSSSRPSAPTATAPKRRVSSSTVPSNTKHAGSPSTATASPTASAAPAPAAPVERKKPRKLVRKDAAAA
ncbi:hypothetical protein CAC42_145 [Sphaceloma murrayae]|uniref:DUF1989 domain-containing protein n=1 Tax=Sphaceloma murrayae TaxID=2082308 RepID=A0A2K1QN37_9PEZI|nr:hypothetical protein CAC42_145 [Sphaceloma murrayae]